MSEAEKKPDHSALMAEAKDKQDAYAAQRAKVYTAAIARYLAQSQAVAAAEKDSKGAS